MVGLETNDSVKKLFKQLLQSKQFGSQEHGKWCSWFLCDCFGQFSFLGFLTIHFLLTVNVFVELDYPGCLSLGCG